MTAVGVASVRYLPCSVLTRDRRSTCPAEYCSITSFTSYGFSASLNLRRAVKYLIYAQEGRQLVCWTKSGLMGTVCRPWKENSTGRLTKCSIYRCGDLKLKKRKPPMYAHRQRLMSLFTARHSGLLQGRGRRSMAVCL